jgi:hypothetical protein
MTVIAQELDFRLQLAQLLYSTLGKHAASTVYVVVFGPAQHHSTIRRQLKKDDCLQ